MRFYAVVDQGILGAFHHKWDETGWRFIPWMDSHRPSRKWHATPQDALPRWAKSARIVEATSAKEALTK